VVCLLGATILLAGETKGKVKKHVYYSPEKNFTVPVPSGINMRVEDRYDAGGAGAVSFRDDFGTQQGVYYMRIPVEVAAKFDEAAHPGELLSRWLNHMAMPGFFPNSRLAHETAAPFESMEVVLAEVEIPSGSTMVVTDRSGTRRLDSTRGLVIFRRGTYVYMLDVEETSASSETNKTEKKDEPAEDWTKFADRIKPFYESISFTD